MKKVLPSFLFLLTIFLLSSSAISQDFPFTSSEGNKYLGNNTADYTDISGVNIVPEKTAAQQNLENEIARLRNENNPANRGTILELNKQLGEMTGMFITKEMTPYPGGGVEKAKDQDPVASEDITNIRIYNNTGRDIKGMATATEQIGANVGRIWAVFGISANTTSPDSLRIFYSTNNGLTWILYANAWLGGTDKINYDDLDIEIIENASGNKYLYAVYGIRATGGTGRWFTGGMVLNITSFAGTLFGFAWPGDNANHRYHNIRITSDNATYPSLAYLYIACTFDSLNASNQWSHTQKYVRCTSPYTTTPTFTYQGPKIWWYMTSTVANYHRNLYTDIAYFRNGSDSVIVSFSGVPDSVRIFFSKMNISGTPSAGTGATNQAGSEATSWKTWARLSTNGNDNGSVLCAFRQLTSGIWNVKYFRTTNFGNFNTVNQSILWGSSVNTNYQPDLVGRRNSNSHYLAFTTIAATDSVHNIKVTSSGTTTHIPRVNFHAITSGAQGPKPGIRFTSDSALTLYSESGPVNVWAALGSTGAITGVPAVNNTPSYFRLSQNYPNPFNPVTKISYSIPVSEMVTLKIFDITGKEVMTLVNEMKHAGTYNLEFDASHLASGLYLYKIEAGEFSDVKKMMLVK